MTTSTYGPRLAAIGTIALCIPLLYIIHTRVVLTKPNAVPSTQYLKAARGPARWNPFQSKAATKDLEMMEGFDGSDLEPVTLIDKKELVQIINVLNKEGREASKYVVIDVRSEEEVARTGKFDDVVNVLPIHCVTLRRAFAMDPKEFKRAFSFDMPTVDETIVFTCKTGKSSKMAAEMAAIEGYVNLLNYVGGANDWFS